MELTLRLSSLQQPLGLLLCLVVCCSACFIRNCPMGGKRSMGSLAEVAPQRECLRCGPEAMGQCVGPNICCGPSMGCFINTEESAACARENQIPTPCEVEGDVCNSVAGGRCVANGICCSDEKCQLDAQCDRVAKNAFQKGGVSTDLLRYIRRLMDRRQYNSRR